MLIRKLYTLVLYIIAPFFLWGLLKKKSNKPSIGQRWPELLGITTPVNHTNDQPVIWIHAVSVGETIAVTPFVKRLHQKYPQAKLVITTTTPTGAEQAEKLGSIAEHRYMPLDFPFAIKRYIKTIKPSHLIIMETELWPNTLTIAKKCGLEISVINARLSEKSYKNYTRLSWLIKPCLHCLQHIYCQTESDKERFKKLGIASDRLTVTGSIKYDIDISDKIYSQSTSLKKELGLHRPIWIAASTHDGEDQILLNAHKKVLDALPEALLILVPRHPERFQDVYNLTQNNGFDVIKRSTVQPVTEKVQVYLADTMGEMLLLLGASDICFMGGSLIGSKVGGHNVLEPASLGIPTITGPSYYNFKDITLELEKNKALTIIHNNSEIAPNIIKLLTNSHVKQTASSNAIAFVEKNKGAIEKTLQHLID